MEQYPLEKAQEEAEKMREKVEFGEAADYREAEELVGKNHEIAPLYRGIWAEYLGDNSTLPVGGSLFSTELTTKMSLDFNFFEKQLQNFNKEHIDGLYEEHKKEVAQWLDKVGSDVDPYLYYVLSLVQTKTQSMLGVDKDDPMNQSPEGVQRNASRMGMYEKGQTPKLSEFVGRSMCAEIAAMGQYLLQRIGVVSTFVAGIAMVDARDKEEYPEDHSFIVLKNPSSDKETFIFDIARPRSQQNVPRLLKTDVPITYGLLKDKNDLLVGATEVLQGGRLWFGVGEPTAGARAHNVIDNKTPTEK